MVRARKGKRVVYGYKADALARVMMERRANTKVGLQTEDGGEHIGKGVGISWS